MRELLPPEVLEIWERGSAQSPTERALTLLHAALPDLEAETLARMSVGRRDGLLLSLRELMFGRQLTAVTNCLKCSERLELAFDVEEVRLPNLLPPSEPPNTIVEAGYELQFRSPDSRDLMFAANAIDVESATQALISRCVVSASRDGRQVDFDQLPRSLLVQMEHEISKRDAQANIQLELGCPSCRTNWTVLFDIVAFFWSELDAWAQRLLVDVHKLASAYGWREADILALSEERRNIYLNLVNA